MKKLLPLFPAIALAIGGLVFAPASARAQAPAANAKEELVKIKSGETILQKTPKFQVDGPRDKHWTPLDWIEIEVEAEAILSKKSTDKKQISYPEATFRYYVYLEGQSPDKSRILTGEVVHTNVPIKEKIHSCMFITPSTIKSLTGKQEGSPSSIKYWGVTVTIGGEMVGYKVKAGSPGTAEKPWWEDPKAPAKEAALKNKNETPFSMLWADYYLDIKAK